MTSLTPAQRKALAYYAAGQTAERMPHTNTLVALLERGLVERTGERTLGGRVRFVPTAAGRAALEVTR